MTRRTRTLVGVSAALLAVAGSSVAIARSHAHRDGRHERRFERLARALDLDANQRSRARSIEDRTFPSRVELEGRERIAQHELRRLIRAEAPDRAAVLAKVEEVGRLRTELAKLRLTVKLEQLELLSPAQKERLRELAEQRQDRRDKRRADRQHRAAGPHGPEARDDDRPDPDDEGDPFAPPPPRDR